MKDYTRIIVKQGCGNLDRRTGAGEEVPTDKISKNDCPLRPLQVTLEITFEVKGY